MIVADLTQFFPFAFIAHLSRALVTFNIVHALLKNKYNSFVTLTSIVGISMITSYIILKIASAKPSTEFLLLVIYYLLQLLIIIFLTKGKLFLKFSAVIFSLLSFLTGTAAFSLLSSFYMDNTVEMVSGYQVDLVYLVGNSLFVFVFSFVLATIISLIKKKKSSNYNYKSKRIFFYIFPISHIFCIETICYAENLLISNNAMNSAESLQKVICIFFLACFLIDISIIFVVDYLEKLEYEEELYIEQLTKNDLEYNQFLILKNEREEFRKIRHDISNLLTVTTGFIEIGKTDKALEILKNTSSDIFNSAIIPISNNETINTIYSIKSNECKNHNIDLRFNVYQKENINVSDYDLCRVLNNIIDNSINAVKDSSVNKCINISININNGIINICSSNEFNNKTITKNKDRKLHGYGQKIISEITKKYDGDFSFNKNGNIYTTNTVLNNVTLPKKNRLKHKLNEQNQ